MACSSKGCRGCSIKEVAKGSDSKCSSCSGCNKLNVYDWLKDIPESTNPTDLVEVRFKNTRKGYFRNVNKLSLKQGDIVAVEASPGHDIGVISLTGELVPQQIRKVNRELLRKPDEIKKVYRKAKPADVEKWDQAVALEEETMLRSRKIAMDLGLNMKIGDVEYQGDRTKAIFYYIADERVDFRQLIKVLAEEFRVRIEMRQIGARQEAGRIGGIGSCGRELCCSTWITNFVSVSTSAARYQELALNPQKLAGQCGKLKCCLNFELDSYLDSRQDFPSTDVPLETEQGKAFHFKTDVFKRIMWYTFERDSAMSMTAVPVDRVKYIQRLNRDGKYPTNLVDITEASLAKVDVGFENVVGQDSVTRFDDGKKKTRNRRKKRVSKPDQPTEGLAPEAKAPESPMPQAEASQPKPQPKPKPRPRPRPKNQPKKDNAAAATSSEPKAKEPNSPADGPRRQQPNAKGENAAYKRKAPRSNRPRPNKGPRPPKPPATEQ